MYKNQSNQKLVFVVKDFYSGLLVSGDASNITATISKDGGAFSSLSDVNPDEIGSSGFYYFTLTQNETNADAIIFNIVSSTSTSVIDPIVIYTNPATVKLTSDGLDNITSFAVGTAMKAIKDKTDNLNFTGTDVKATLDGEEVILTSAYDAAKTAASQDSVDTANNQITAIKAKTDNLPENPAAVGSEMKLENGAIKADTFDNVTNFPNRELR